MLYQVSRQWEYHGNMYIAVYNSSSKELSVVPANTEVVPLPELTDSILKAAESALAKVWFNILKEKEQRFIYSPTINELESGMILQLKCDVIFKKCKIFAGSVGSLERMLHDSATNCSYVQMSLLDKSFLFHTKINNIRIHQMESSEHKLKKMAKGIAARREFQSPFLK